MYKVIHLIPYDAIGGVENSARAMSNVKHNRIDFIIKYIFPKNTSANNKRSTFNPIYFLKSAYSIKKENPDLLIMSLWRSCIVGMIIKLISPETKIILFLHSSNDVHLLDYYSTRIASRFVYAVWADSQSTLSERLTLPSEKNKNIISFLTKHHKPQKNRTVNANFIFWGRLHPQKNLEKSITIFASVKKIIPEAQFTIIGPNGGSLSNINKIVKKNGLNTSISILGEHTFEQIKEKAFHSSFYLQTSNEEGMALSVIEAMQLGLVPVVKPVGEIKNYCDNNKNALFVDSNFSPSKIKELIENPKEYEAMSIAAINQWINKETYTTSVIRNITSIMSD